MSAYTRTHNSIAYSISSQAQINSVGKADEVTNR